MKQLIKKHLPGARFSTQQGNLHTVTEDISMRTPRSMRFGDADTRREQALFGEWQVRANEALAEIKALYHVEDSSIDFNSDGSATLFFVADIDKDVIVTTHCPACGCELRHPCKVQS